MEESATVTRKTIVMTDTRYVYVSKKLKVKEIFHYRFCKESCHFLKESFLCLGVGWVPYDRKFH